MKKIDLGLTIIALILVCIVSTVVGVFETTGQSAPVLTRALISLSSFLRSWWWLVIIAVVGTATVGINRLLSR